MLEGHTDKVWSWLVQQPQAKTIDAHLRQIAEQLTDSQTEPRISACTWDDPICQEIWNSESPDSRKRSLRQFDPEIAKSGEVELSRPRSVLRNVLFKEMTFHRK